MAKKSGTKAVRSGVRAAAPRLSPTGPGKVTKPVKSAGAKKPAGVLKAAKPEEPTKSTAPVAKKVSTQLMEAIERRKQEKGQGPQRPNLFGRPAGRRGRRPKRPIEYTPTNGEENNESFDFDMDYQRIEYDTGIRVRELGQDESFNLDRFEDFDEELNFDR